MRVSGDRQSYVWLTPCTGTRGHTASLVHFYTWADQQCSEDLHCANMSVDSSLGGELLPHQRTAEWKSGQALTLTSGKLYLL